ncbi:(d)CMP kinase [Butyricicoccus pullicaecorum]|uniref:Cytidylate kinase n=2 Tax=Butyricicoccus pullicaecorum TaxID=501571 RepID=R8W8U7_9FIRM|nr:(d)CMP kinase [Butyricicoccus pullicaecorum]EOQ41335.1 cytidylate kinase [Butyricicoccus pullicaecorum 1.2]OUP56208.1 cytidylate kinase [Butyricicoccus pullicaecorum]SKA62487.1 cytidylate kinase [Butyricicoccus pullicaecorum DSM 23266]
MNQDVIAVAIDGPAGAGKSTIARAAAAQLGFVYVDTGALYRTIGLAVCRRGIDGTDVPGILATLPEIQVGLTYQDGAQHVLLDGEDVSDAIRTPQISTYASQVSSVPEVRAYLLDLQRDLARRQSVIMDGRDIGTVILPDAKVKIFLTASPEKRAARRCAELREKGQDVTVEGILADMERRDALDASRAVAPLKQAEDAVLVDTSDLTLEQSIEAVLTVIRDKMKGA